MAGDWGQPHNPWDAYDKTLNDAVTRRLNTAQAVGQEQKNPLISREMLANILSKEIENKYAPRKNEADIGYKNEETTNSRYKREHGLLEPNEVQILKQAYGGNIPTGVVQAITQQRAQQSEQPQQQSSPISQAIQQSQSSYPGMTMMNQPSTDLSKNISQSMQQVQQPQQQSEQQPQQQQFIQGTNLPSTGRGGLADAMVLHALGMSPETAGNAEYKKVMTEVAEKNLKAGNFDKMPAAQKQYAINQAMGFGLSNTEATKKFRNGETIEDIAKEKGFDANKPNEWPTPVAPPTTAMLSQQQRANVANAALNAIDPIIGDAIAPYATRWDGKSLDMLRDAVKGENVDRQAKAIAAGALSMEVAALRLRAGGSPSGITALKEMVSKSQNKLDVIGPSLSPEVYKKSQQEITRMINIINNTENKAAWNQQQKSFDEEDTQQASSENNSSDPMGLL